MTALVVGHSRHPGSEVALGVAIDLARRLRAELHVVHVVALEDLPVDPDSARWEEEGRAAVAEQRRRVARRLEEEPVPWRHRVERGDPAAVLSRVADETSALMVVVGTHSGLAHLGRALLGEASVSRSALRHGRHPVLIVPADAVAPLDDGPVDGDHGVGKTVR